MFKRKQNKLINASEARNIASEVIWRDRTAKHLSLDHLIRHRASIGKISCMYEVHKDEASDLRYLCYKAGYKIHLTMVQGDYDIFTIEW